MASSHLSVYLDSKDDGQLFEVLIAVTAFGLILISFIGYEYPRPIL